MSKLRFTYRLAGGHSVVSTSNDFADLAAAAKWCADICKAPLSALTVNGDNRTNVIATSHIVAVDIEKA